MIRCIDANGTVLRWPRKEKDRQAVMAHLVSFFAPNIHFTEKEVNKILQAHHSFGDWALLRRELFERGFLERNPEKGIYWRKPNKLNSVVISRKSNQLIRRDCGCL